MAYHYGRLPLEVLDESRCPPKLARLIRSCWETDPARRPAAAELIKKLELVRQVRLYGGWVPIIPPAVH